MEPVAGLPGAERAELAAGELVARHHEDVGAVAEAVPGHVEAAIGGARHGGFVVEAALLFDERRLGGRERQREKNGHYRHAHMFHLL